MILHWAGTDFCCAFHKVLITPEIILDIKPIFVYNKNKLDTKGMKAMLNIIFLMGRLTADPEIKTAEDSRFCKFNLAVQRPKRKNDKVAEADFFNCIAWNRNADVICDWFKKGDLITVVGTFRNHKYEKDGINRVATQVVIREIHFTGNRKEDSIAYDFSYDPEEFEEIFADEDVPF